MKEKRPSEQHSEEETEQRREAALKRMLTTPHKPHKSGGKLPPKKRVKKTKPGG
jgi:hypothetical protein